jgi:arginyl-tRNA synthetase
MTRTYSTADGTTIYITRDIGAAKERYAKYAFDKMIYVVASQQNLHLAQFFKVLELMGYDWAKDGRLEHINFGMGAFYQFLFPFFPIAGPA